MRYRAILFMICSLLGINTHLKAETVIYDFSSASNWVTEPNGDSHPNTGTSAVLNKIYYKETNDCFIGKGDVYFSDGYLMLNSSASLQIPHNENWIINKITLHAHSGGSTNVKVNIYNSYEGGAASSTALTWEKKDYDYEYPIKDTHKQSQLYIRATNSYNARITKVTIDYTLKDYSSSPSVSAPIFNPSTSTFSLESLDIAISAAKGCDIYYTTDGTTPSLENLEECSKGNIATIYASNSPVVLNAIAIDPISGECSNVSRATYTYIDPTTENDGTKERPFTVAEVKRMTINKLDRWVRGVIYGTMVNADASEVVTSDFSSSTNIVIGDELTNIPIKLSDNEALREAINLVDHPYLLGKEILIKGSLTDYCSSKGVTEVEEYKITYDVPINSYGYATLFLDMPVSVPSGSKAYYCTIEDNYAKLHSIETIIPDSVGVILGSSPNTTCTLYYSPTGGSKIEEENIRSTNRLIGYTKDHVIPNSEYAYYALNVKDNKLGFYIPQSMTDSEFMAKANKAYLQVPVENKVAMFVIRREVSGLETVHINNILDETVYDFWGRMILTPTSGIYIKGGKKIIVR